jgi:hypothetical protein
VARKLECVRTRLGHQRPSLLREPSEDALLALVVLDGVRYTVSISLRANLVLPIDLAVDSRERNDNSVRDSRLVPDVAQCRPHLEDPLAERADADDDAGIDLLRKAHDFRVKYRQTEEMPGQEPHCTSKAYEGQDGL